MDHYNLEEAVKNLPEIYQPIFKHQELSSSASRVCDNRLVYIKKIYDALAIKKGASLNVLDLGCAQGYISLSIASWGAKVTGVDFLDKNVKVCNLLADENSELQVKFVCGKIEELIQRIPEGKYDLVLGLSVFHHLCNLYGYKRVQELLEILSKKVTAGIFELALKEEPLYWALSLPEDYREVLEGFSCIKFIAEMSTHLSEIQRPLCYVSNDYVYFLDGTLVKIDKHWKEAHNYAIGTHLGTRDYYIGEGNFIKAMRINNIGPGESRNDYNKQEIENERKFLEEMNGDLDFPKIEKYEQNSHDIWLMRRAYNGTLLSTLIKENKEYDKWNVVKEVLKKLAELEKRGFYCNDLRVWNILVDDNICRFIDYGSFTKENTDCQWPENAYVSFLLFINEVIEKDIRVVPIRKTNVFTTLHKYLPHEKVSELLNLKCDSNLFTNAYNIMFNDTSNVEKHSEQELTLGENITKAEEKLLNLFADKQQELQQRNDVLEVRTNDLQEQITALNNTMINNRQELDAIKNSKAWKSYVLISQYFHKACKK